MTQQELGAGLGIRGYIERFGIANAGNRACSDVSHGISAGLTRGNTYRGQSIHNIRRVVDMNIVQLNILAGGDVQDGVRVLFG